MQIPLLYQKIDEVVLKHKKERRILKENVKYLKRKIKELEEPSSSSLSEDEKD
jgi:hypothetical protein